MKKVYIVTLIDKYGDKWLPDYSRVFASQKMAEKHAEELRNMPNSMEHEVIVQETYYVE